MPAADLVTKKLRDTFRRNFKGDAETHFVSDHKVRKKGPNKGKWVNARGQTREEHAAWVRERVNAAQRERRKPPRKLTIVEAKNRMVTALVPFIFTFIGEDGDVKVTRKRVDFAVKAPAELSTRTELMSVLQPLIDAYLSENNYEYDADEAQVDPKEEIAFIEYEPPPLEDADPGRLPLREVTSPEEAVGFRVLMFDDDMTRQQLLKDPKYQGLFRRGQCVPSYLAYHMNKGRRWVGTPEHLLAKVKRHLVSANEPYFEDGDVEALARVDAEIARKDVEGYTADDIVNFCVEVDIPCILFVPHEEHPLRFWLPHEPDQHLKAVAGIVTGNHLLIPGERFRDHALKMLKLQGERSDGGRYYQRKRKRSKGNDHDDDNGQENGSGATRRKWSHVYQIIDEPDEAYEGDNGLTWGQCAWQALADSTATQGKLPSFGSIRYSRKLNGPRKWSFFDTDTRLRTVCLYGRDHGVAMRLAAALGMEYKGDALGTVVRKFHDIVYWKGKPVYGRPSPDVMREVLMPQHAKDCCVRGWMDTRVDAKDVNFEEDTLTLDMVSAYPTLMYNPRAKWMMPRFDDEVRRWTQAHEDKGELPDNTLFYVKLDARYPERDGTLEFFQKRSGWFDTERLRFARAHGYGAFAIHFYVTFSETAEKTLHSKVLAEMTRLIVASSETEAHAYELVKHVGRVYSGVILGVHKMEDPKTYYTSSAEEAWLFAARESLCKHRAVEHKVPLPGKKVSFGDDPRTFHFVVSFADRHVTATNAAQYMQLTNWAAISLFELKAKYRAVFGRVLFVNVDSITFAFRRQSPYRRDHNYEIDDYLDGPNPALAHAPELLRNRLGRVRVSTLKRTFGAFEGACPRPAIACLVSDPTINDSSQYDAIIDLGMQRGGLAMFGRPGTGKSFVLQHILQRLLQKNTRVGCTAFMHRAKNRFGIGKNVMTIAALVGRCKGLDEGHESREVDLDPRSSAVHVAAENWDVIIV